MQQFIESLLTRVEGLRGVAIYDKEGNLLYRASYGEDVDQVFESSTLSSVFLVACEQVKKLGIKNNRSIVSIYENHQIIQFNYSQVIVTLIADIAANTGVLMDLYPDVADKVQTLSSSLVL